MANEDGLRSLGDVTKKPGSAGSSSLANEEGLRALGQDIRGKASPTRKSNKSRRRRRVKWTLSIVSAFIVLVVAAGGGYAWYLNNQIHRIHVGGLSKSPGSGADQGTENILMVGSTSRCVLAHPNPAYGLCSQGVTGVNGDVIMILHLNPVNRTVSILSIPRDLFIPNARTTGANKIDAGLYDGPTQLVHSIEEDFGIPIQHYVELNFDTFINVVNALGGIKMYFPMPVFDRYSGLNVQVPGCHFLNGTQALQVVRARHLQYKGPGVTSNNPAYWPQEVQSDIARIRRDHEFLRVLAAAVAKKGLGNPITDQKLVAAVAPQLTVDSGFSASHMVNLVLTYHAVNINASPQMTLPVLIGTYNGPAAPYIYKGGNYGDVEFPQQPIDRQVIDKFLGLAPNKDTMNGPSLPNPSQVSVSVMNGTGVYNQASTTAQALGALGFKIVGIGNTPPVGRVAETVVYYSSMNPSEEAAAQRVADSMSGSVIMALNPFRVTNGAQVTVVTGTSFAVNPPAPPPSTTSPGSSSTSSTVASGTATTQPTSSSVGSSANASITSGNFAKPTPPTQPLAPWDPRSCTASGGEGP